MHRLRQHDSRKDRATRTLATLLAAAATLVVAFPSGGSAALAAVERDITSQSGIFVDTFAVSMPNDPNRCVTSIFVEFPDVEGAVSYSARILNRGFSPPREQTFGATPPTFPDDEYTIFLGAGFSKTIVAPAGRHRIFISGSSSGSGCASDIWIDLLSMTVMVESDNEPPVASFTWEARDDEPLMVDFDASASTDDEGIESWEWDFGDGASGTGEETEHPYAAGGTYPVKLTVTDGEGLSDTTTLNVTVSCSGGPSDASFGITPRSALAQAAEGACELELTIEARPPRPQGVQRTEQIEYALDARVIESGCDCPLEGEVDSLVVTATVRADLVDVDEASITEGGTLSPDGSTVEWTFANTAEAPTMSFVVTVRSDAPRSVLFISTQARARASLESGVEVTASRLAQTPLLQFGLLLLGDFVAERGDHVIPKDVATVRVQADAREEADEIVLHAFVPKGSHLVPDSITGGGTQEGERAIRWRFTNVKETPIVTFQIKVDTLEELPKDLKKLQAKTTAEAKFDDVPESAENTLAIDLVRPTTIRGVTLDIVQGASSHLAVQTPARAGVDVRLSELLSKRVVDTAKSDGSGSFSVEAGKPMRYLLESFQTAPTTKFGARPVFSRHIIEVRDGGEVWVNGRLQPTREDGSLEPLDVYVPISLVVLADKLLVALGDTDIPYWAFLRIDIGPILDFANSIGLPFTDIRFDTAEVTRVVDSALELTQVRLDGSPAQFGGLYEPGNPATERDGWNAVLRLNVMLTQLGADSTNPRRFGDALSIIRPIALAIALQVTTTAVKALAKKLKTPRAGATWRFYRISYMSEVVGVLTPLAIDIANLAGAGVDKGKWVEWIAKGSRYGMDLVMGVLEKNARWWTLFDDLTFEVIFNAVRVGVTSIMLDGWINLMAQQSLDAVGSLKSTFAGSTRAINDFVTDTERRLGTGLLSVRTLQQIQSLEATVVSMIRAFDGILSTWKAAYGHIDIDPRSKRPPSLHAIERLQNALGKSFGAGARGDEALQRVALAVNLLAIQTGVVGLEALGLEVQKIAGALTTGATASRRIAPASPVESRMATGTAAPSETSGRSARSTTSVRKLVSAAATYRSVLRDLHAAFADRTAPAAHTDVRDWRRFDQASTRIASALEPLLRRALLVRASAQGRERQRIVAFIEASRALADAQLVATEQLDPSLAAPGSNVDERAVAPALATLDARTRLLARAVTSSRPALGGAIAGALMATPADLELPRDAVIVSGRPFAVRLTVWNVGDKPTMPALVSLTSSRNLKLVSRAAVPIKRMRAGERVILRWRLRATRSGAPQLAANATFLIRKTDSVVGALDVPIFAFGAPRSR